MPVPLPLAPPVMVMKGELLVAVQGHPAELSTVTVPLPPEDAYAWFSGVIE